jgi:hypothetical protein
MEVGSERSHNLGEAGCGQAPQGQAEDGGVRPDGFDMDIDTVDEDFDLDATSDNDVPVFGGNPADD